MRLEIWMEGHGERRKKEVRRDQDVAATAEDAAGRSDDRLLGDCDSLVLAVEAGALAERSKRP